MKKILEKINKIDVKPRKGKLIGGLVIIFVVIMIVIVIFVSENNANKNYSSIDQKLITDELNNSLTKGSESDLQPKGLWAGILSPEYPKSKISPAYEVTPTPIDKHFTWDWISNKNTNNTVGSFLSWNPNKGNGGELELYFYFLVKHGTNINNSESSGPFGSFISGYISNSSIHSSLYTIPKKPSVDWFKNSFLLVKVINMKIVENSKINTTGFVWEGTK